MNSITSTSWNPNELSAHEKWRQAAFAILRFMVLLATSLAIANAADSRSDGFDHAVETNTGVVLSPSNIGTNPNAADIDKRVTNSNSEVLLQDGKKLDSKANKN